MGTWRGDERSQEVKRSGTACETQKRKRNTKGQGKQKAQLVSRLVGDIAQQEV